MVDGQARVQFRLPFEVRQEGSWHFSNCPILDVHSQGRTREEAVGNLIEALQLFIESCFERGTLTNVLLASGFEPAQLAQPAADDGDYLDVPISLVARQHVENRAH